MKLEYLPGTKRCLLWAMPSLFILGFSLITLTANQLSVLASTRSGDSDFIVNSNIPIENTALIITLKPKNTRKINSSLVSAIKNSIGNNLSNFFDKVEYFAAEVDLNSDGTKEVIVYTASPRCGAWECPVDIFKKSGSGYHLIGKTAAASNEAQIAVLSSKSNGWLDVATLVYNSQEMKSNWKLHKFNGSEYKNTFQNLTSTPSQIILRPNRGSGINLGEAGSNQQ